MAVSKEWKREYNRKYREKNKESIKQRMADYYEKNKNKIIAHISKSQTQRQRTDPIFNMKKRISGRLRNALSSNGFTKKSTTGDVLGCTWEEFKVYFESKFTVDMSWENRHLWHIDHIMPLETAKTEEEIIKLNHYTNLQPLWGKENIQKGARYEQAAI